MPPLGDALGQSGVSEVTGYVLSLSGVKVPAEWVARVRRASMRSASPVMAPMVAAIQRSAHRTSPMRPGSMAGDFAHVAESIRNGRNGVMPGWRSRLSEDQLRMVAAWVLAKGDGASAAAGC